ncbi:MAG TPA: PEGA domain-containing protein [Polyangiaceae bacterium]
MSFRSSRQALLALLLATQVATYADLCSAEEAHAGHPATSGEATQEERRASARARYQEGADAYSAGRYKDAVDLFLEADQLFPSAPLSFNVARAYEHIGDDAGALRWYRDYLRRAPAAENAADVKAIIAALAQTLAKKGVQQLTVLSSPAGATVTVDGTPVGVTPWTGELSPGKHRLLLTYRGYTDERRAVVLSATEPREINLQLEQSTAATTSPESAASVESSGPRLGPLPWLSLGVGAAALGAALALEVSRRSAESDARQEVTQLGYQSRLETEQSRQTAARVLAGIGGGLAVVGGVMLLLDSKDTAHAATASAGFVCVPQLCAVSAGSRF